MRRPHGPKIAHTSMPRRLETVATSTTIRWCCRSALHRPTILCSALDRQFIRNRLPDERARLKSRARSRLRTCKSERQYDDEPAAIPGFDAVFSLVDGCDGADHARHWCCDGGVARRLLSAVFYSLP